ncbi:hypothetical protein [Brevibacillus reuszeri]|uniref:hypothetical protein n=1 Tax=Brevibacillus reuszeri TaxID=54915 RepID=UPI000CCC4F23|nr:hypothetical protein [Brevibacillus reuszeri]
MSKRSKRRQSSNQKQIESQSLIPTFLDTSILLAVFSGAAYISTYFSLLTKYRLYGIPTDLIDVSLNKMISIGVIFFIVAIAITFLVFIFLPTENALKKTRFFGYICFYTIPFIVLLLIFYLVPMSFTVLWVILGILELLFIVLDIFLECSKRINKISVSNKYLLFVIIVTAPVFSILFSSISVTYLQSITELVPKNNVVETSYSLEKGMKVNEVIKVNQKEKVTTTTDILVSLRSTDFPRMFIVGEYENSFITRTVIYHLVQGKLVPKFALDNIELIPKNSDYLLREVPFDYRYFYK